LIYPNITRNKGNILQHTDDVICVALYFFSAGCFVIEISVKKMKKNKKQTRDYFKFAIMNFPYNNSNISTAPAYRVYISQLRRYVHRRIGKDWQEEERSLFP
jgi:uncharacterized protein YsxB (DUF464 family)